MIAARQLVSERMILGPLAPAEITQTYVDWLNDPTINRFLEVRLHAQTLDGVKDFVASINGSEHSCMFAMRLRDNGQHVGNIKIGPINGFHRRAEIGLVIGESSCWGKGFATEAIAAVTRFGHDDLGLHKIQAGIYVSNIGSYRAFLKAGYTHEATLRRQWRLVDGWEDEHVVAHFEADKS